MNITAKIQNNPLLTAKITPQENILVTNYQVSTSNITLNDLIDVDAGSAQDGSLLSYNSNTQTWKALMIIENPNTEINGGFF